MSSPIGQGQPPLVNGNAQSCSTLSELIKCYPEPAPAAGQLTIHKNLSLSYSAIPKKVLKIYMYDPDADSDSGGVTVKQGIIRAIFANHLSKGNLQFMYQWVLSRDLEQSLADLSFVVYWLEDVLDFTSMHPVLDALRVGARAASENVVLLMIKKKHRVRDKDRTTIYQDLGQVFSGVFPKDLKKRRKCYLFFTNKNINQSCAEDFNTGEISRVNDLVLPFFIPGTNPILAPFPRSEVIRNEV